MACWSAGDKASAAAAARAGPPHLEPGPAKPVGRLPCAHRRPTSHLTTHFSTQPQRLTAPSTPQLLYSPCVDNVFQLLRVFQTTRFKTHTVSSENYPQIAYFQQVHIQLIYKQFTELCSIKMNGPLHFLKYFLS